MKIFCVKPGPCWVPFVEDFIPALVLSCKVKASIKVILQREKVQPIEAMYIVHRHPASHCWKCGVGGGVGEEHRTYTTANLHTCPLRDKTVHRRSDSSLINT